LCGGSIAYLQDIAYRIVSIGIADDVSVWRIYFQLLQTVHERVVGVAGYYVIKKHKRHAWAFCLHCFIIYFI